MEISEDSHCFVCGPLNTEGLQAGFEINREHRRACCRLVIPARFQGWSQVVHGGILSSLLDEASIYACREEGSRLLTAELSVRFRKPVPVEREVAVTAEVVTRKKRLFTVRAWLELDGQVHAEADAKVILLA